MVTKKAVTKKTDTVAVSPYEEEDVGAGFEDFTSDDIQIPFLNILQALSPQVDKGDALYIDGAEPSMIFNSVTEELFDGEKGILFIPVHRIHQFIEWVPRREGGGFIAFHSPTSPLVMAEKEAGKFAEMQTPDGNDLVDTFTVFGLRVMPDESYEHAVISFSKTAIPSYRKWMSKAKAIIMKTKGGERITPPLYAHTYHLTTRQFENNKGKWHGWHIGFGSDTASDSRIDPDDPLFVEAKQFRQMILDGVARAAMDSVTRAAEDPDEM